MGQCSTLPADTRTAGSVVSRHENFHAKEMLMEEQRHRLKEEGRKQSLDFNKIEANPEDRLEEIRMEARRNSRLHEMKQTRDAESMRSVGESPVPMEIESAREAIPVMPPLVLPPECSVPTRCYKLNLDSELVGLSSSQKQHLCLGPFTEPPPPLTYSSSEDSAAGISPTTVAIQTAQIFRGITVSRDGTILTQNARATRSNRGKPSNKRGEKSRQASKIDKAKDLVEEIIATGKAPESDEPANMVSLYVMGEYDDMKYLVRDGSKKLREANGNGLSDDHLRSINRQRHRSPPHRPVASSSVAASMLSPRKRVSPSLVTSQRTAALQNPEKLSSTLPQSAPPKLKSHPRDTRPSRREVPKMRLDACHDFMDPRRVGPGGDDWSHAWNIWNCGGAGTVSPVQPSSPNDAMHQGANPTPVYEGRESNGNAREGGSSVARMD